MFGTALANTPDFVYLFDLDGRFTYVNKALLDLWGKDLAQAVGRNFHELEYPSELAVRLQQQIQEVIESKQTVRDETVYTSAAGTRSYEYILVPVFGTDGAVEAVAGSTRDITDRRLAEVELRDIRSRMEAALEAGAIGTWTWDVPADRFYADASLARLFSLEPDDVSGAPLDRIVEAIHPGDRERVSALVNQAVASGSRYEADYRVSQPNGSWRWVTARGQVERDTHGRAVRFPGVVIDVTDRKQAEEAFRVADARAGALLESLNEGFVAFDRDWTFTYLNAAYERMIGVRREDLIGRNHWEVFPAALGTTLEAEFRRVAVEGCTAEFENYYEPWDRWFALKAYPSGNGIAAQVRDVTAARRAAEDLARVSAEAEQLRRLYEAVLSGTPDFVYVFSLDHRVLYANEALVTMWGLGPENAIGKTFLEIGYEPWHAEMHAARSTRCGRRSSRSAARCRSTGHSAGGSTTTSSCRSSARTARSRRSPARLAT